MNQQLAIVTLLAVCYAHSDDKATATVNGEVHSGISPKLDKSDKKFFGKDYPWDKRPAVDVLHFKHPYPVVQDSGDFDRDYVKDENSDNGSWKAQMTYDRLRAKLRKEKRELAEALARKQSEEDGMRDALQRHDKAAKDFDEAAKRAERRRAQRLERERLAREEARKKEPEVVPPKVKKVFEKAKRVVVPKDPSTDVEGATQDTEGAMENLEECKKQLADAREALKERMKELEDAKAAQEKANEALDEAMKKELSEKEHHAVLKRQVSSEYKEYVEAKEAYERQSADVSKLEAQIKAAAAKVKAIRDAEDNSGGVYQTPEENPHKSAALAASWALLP